MINVVYVGIPLEHLWKILLRKCFITVSIIIIFFINIEIPLYTYSMNENGYFLIFFFFLTYYVICEFSVIVNDTFVCTYVIEIMTNK